ncbi:MAG: polymorphic toxin type 50 domain-containing protein [Polyangia bacterium]
MGFAACLLGVLGPSSVRAQEQAPLPLRVLPMPLGTLCSGVLPSCARNGDTGLHLRIGMLAGLREDRSVGWVQGDAGFLISVMRWAEVGVYLPVTWFDSIRPTLQPLRFGGKVGFLSPSRWQRLWGSAFTEVRIAKGPFSGAGSPLGEQPTAVDVGVAMETRVWLFHAQGMAWLTGAQTGLELHAGAEAGFRGDSISPFIQARLDSHPGCPPSASPLCGVGGVVLGGLRGSFDAVSATPFAGVGQGSGHSFILAGLHTGLSFDVDFVQRHGDGSAQVQAWWERRMTSARQWWAEQLAEQEYGPLAEKIERQRQALQRHLGERLSSYLDEVPDPLEALRQFYDAVGGERELTTELSQPLAAATLTELRAKMAEQRTRLTALQHHPARRKQVALRRDPEGYPVLARRDAGIAWERFVAEQNALFEQIERERQQREEAQRIPYRPLVLPPMEKVALNAAVLAPFELLAAFYMGSPEGVAQMAAIRKDLRWLPYTEEERELGEAMEAAYQTMFSVGTTLAGGASRAAGLAATRGAVRAMEAEVAAMAARSAETTVAPGERLLSRVASRLNPFNYAIDGLGSNFGNVRFRPPSGTSLALGEAAERSAAAGERSVAAETRAAAAETGVAAPEANAVGAPERAVPTIHWGKQRKHLPNFRGRGFIEGRSELTADPTELVQRAGTGESMNGLPAGQAGAKERVDFGREIGVFVKRETRERMPTTKAMIIYDKDSVHIVPVRP